MDKHVYSYSQLQSVSDCPYSYYLQRIERVPDVLSNAFAEQGTLIHDLIDSWAKGTLLKEELVYEYEQRYPNEVVSKFPRMLAAKGYTEKAYQIGIDYFENFDCFEGYTIINTEEKFENEINGRLFTGIIDMVMEDNKTGELIVLDHKSKSLQAFKKSENEMYRQPLIYSKYVKEKYGKFPDRLMFNLFKEKGKKMERKFYEEQYNDAIKWACEMIERIENNIIIDWLETKPHKEGSVDMFCQEICSVRKHCTYGNKKR